METKKYIFGEIIHEMYSTSPNKKPTDYDFFKNHMNIGPNQCNFLKTLTNIIQKNQKDIFSASMPPSQFEKLLENHLTDRLIEETARSTTDITTMPKNKAQEEINEKIESYNILRKQFIDEIKEGYKLYQRAEILQQQYPQNFIN